MFFLSDFGENGIEAHLVNPCADFGLTTEGLKGLPQLQHDILKNIFPIFVVDIVGLAQTSDDALVGSYYPNKVSFLGFQLTASLIH